MEHIKVALLGCGTVGGGVYKIITASADELAAKTGFVFDPVVVASRDPTSVPVPESLLTDDALAAARHPEADIAIELIGGTDVAYEVVMAAIEEGKHVVTANKALLAERGADLFAAARRKGVCIGFEASCVGGVPIIGALQQGLIANRIDALCGIVNGTCNYILSEMRTANRSYQEVLADAQQRGYAEADPTLDVSGMDSAHKLALLASLAFGIQVDFSQIAVEGIDSLDLTDIHAGAELGYVVKLLAIGVREADGINLRVHPAFIRTDHPLASVTGPFNAVSIYGDAVGHVLLYGRGAGSAPTASAVVSDLVDVALGNANRTFQQLRIWPDLHPAASLKPIERIASRYYIRLMVYDRPGVMASVSRVFGDHSISLSAVVQHETPEDQPDKNVVPVVVMTHRAVEGSLRAALAEIEKLPVVTCKPACIRVVEQYPEPHE